MKFPYLMLAAGLVLRCGATPIVTESFDYAASAPLTTANGGQGWIGAWYDDGATAVTGGAGLGFTDFHGNVLNVSGLSADTAGTATTRSLRQLSASPLNNVWISFLYRLPATNNKFEGVSFYLGTQPVFSVSNPSTAATAAIYLTSNLTSNNGINTGSGIFGTTHLIVLRMIKGGGTGGTDRIQVFIDPTLNGVPTAAHATIDGTNFDVDRVRLAGQDGASLLVDEFRVGTTFEDVTPHSAGPGTDSDGDGLADGEEAVLGLDPFVSDAALISAIQAHPDWFGLDSASGILGMGNGGVVFQQEGEAPLDFIFEVQQSEDLSQWGVLETFSRVIDLPTGKNFLRVTLQDL